MNNAFRKEPDAEKPHVRNSVRDTFGNGCIYSTYKYIISMIHDWQWEVNGKRKDINAVTMAVTRHWFLTFRAKNS